MLLPAHTTPRAIVLPLVVLLALVSGGCATVGREDAARLAAAGAETASASREFLSTTASGIERTVEASYLIAPLTGRNPPSTEMLASAGRVRAAVSARAAVFRDLGTVYAGFAALAAYDAEGQVAAALTGLTGAVNEYGKIVSPGSTALTDAGAALISRTGGLIARCVQSRKLRAASEEIRAPLEQIGALLKQERMLLSSVREEAIQQDRHAALALADRGLAVPHPLLGGFASRFGLEYDRAALARTAGDVDSLRKAVEYVVERRATREADAQDALVGEIIAGVSRLVAEHKRLEAGAPLDLAAVAGHVALIRAYVADLTALASDAAREQD